MTNIQLPATGDGVLDKGLDRVLTKYLARRDDTDEGNTNDLTDEEMASLHRDENEARQAIHSYVSAAVQEAIKSERESLLDWFHLHLHRIAHTNAKDLWMYGGGPFMRTYPTLDALVSSEMLKEKA